MNFGYEEGEVCQRKSCHGIIELAEAEGCSCHINPPCSSCTTPREFCPVCDWRAKDDVEINGFIANVDPKTQVIRHYERRKLDPTKIDYHVLTHTHASQICEGVYPEGTTHEQVESLVKGTFGGRFEHFKDGQFRYIAYTD